MVKRKNEIDDRNIDHIQTTLTTALDTVNHECKIVMNLLDKIEEALGNFDASTCDSDRICHAAHSIVYMIRLISSVNAMKEHTIELSQFTKRYEKHVS